MNFKLSISFLLFFFVITFTNSASAATITVNTLTDENNTNGAACSLREAINNANGDNTTNGLGCVAGSGTDDIVFSVNGTITPTTVLPTITTSLNVTGNGAGLLTISGNNAQRVFVINGGTVSINNLTAANGFNAVQAGAIYNTAPATTLSGIIVTNSVSGQGGGLQNDGTMTINNSSFINNTATSFAAGVSNFGTLTVSNSIFSGNVSQSDSGGIGNNGNLTVADSTFTVNTAPSFGSAINHSGGGSFSVTRSTMTGNLASAAISVDSSAVSNISNSTFFNNGRTAINANSLLNLINCTISGNRSGAINMTGGASATLINNIIAGNTNAAGTSQLDIQLSGGSINTANSFNNIVGTGGAGGLTNGTNGNQVGVSLANVRLLPLGSYGGSVQTMPIRPNSPARNAGTNTGAPATDARGFNRPQATTTDIGAFEIQTNSIVTNTNNSGTGSLRDVVAVVASGEIVQFETPTFDTAQTILLSSGQINLTRNTTIYGNGANLLSVQNTASVSPTSRVFSVLNLLTVTFEGMTITGGSSVLGGSGINTTNGTVTVNNCYIHSNSTAAYGAGIRNNTGTLIVNNTTISNNIANSDADSTDNVGGGIDSSGTLILNNSTISGNSVLGTGTGSGGGVYTRTATISGSTITNNSAPGGANASGLIRGGGIVTVRNSIIAANQNNTTVPDVAGSFTSSGYNLVGNVGTSDGFIQPTDQTGTSPLFENSHSKSLAPSAVIDPSLLPLALNGGTVPTHTPRGNSLVIDKGNSFGSTTDARGLLRPVDLAVFANAAGGDGADIGAFEFQFAPTAANVSVSGRVLTASGAGLTNTLVYLTASNGTTRTVKTTSFGNFVFENVTSGETYTISIVSRKLQFAPQILTVNESVAGLDFTAIEQ